MADPRHNSVDSIRNPAVIIIDNPATDHMIPTSDEGAEINRAVFRLHSADLIRNPVVINHNPAFVINYPIPEM